MTTKPIKRVDISSGIWAVKGYKDVDDIEDVTVHEAIRKALDICPEDDVGDDIDDCEGLVFVMSPYNSGQIVFIAEQLKFIAGGGDTSSMPLVNDAYFIGLTKLDDFDKIIIGLSND